MSRQIRMLFLGLIVAMTVAGMTPVRAAVPAGTKMKSIVLPKVQGGELDLKKAAKGKVLLLVYWSLTCGQCAKDIPKVLKLLKDYQGKPVRVIFVNGDGIELLGAIKNYLSKKGITQLSVVDQLLIDDYVYKKSFRVMATPGIAVVDRSGVVRYCKDGVTEIYMIAKAINQALATGGGGGGK